MTGRVADLYLRKSTDDAGRSVDRQLEELTNAAAEQYLEIGKVFVDPNFSASRFARVARPDYGALLEHIRAGSCKILGLYEVSRGSRDLTNWSGFLDLCIKKKVKIWVSTHERIYDPNKRSDWLTLASEGVNAADESHKISERVLSGKKASAKKGRPAGRLQYGFVRQYDERGDFKTQVPHEEQAPIIEEMVLRVARGESLDGIARDLNGRGIKLPKGGFWRGVDIRKMVMRPAYAGLRVHHGEIVGNAAWKPIVPVDEWRRAVAILSDPNRRTSRGTELKHWLTGIMKCGNVGCSETLKAFSSGRHRPGLVRYACDSRYGCGGVYVTAHLLEEFVEQTLLLRLKAPDAMAIFVPRRDDAELRAAEEELRELNQKLDELSTEFMTGKITARMLGSVESRLLAKIQQAEATVKSLSGPPPSVALDFVDVDRKWAGFGPATKRTYVRTFMELVVAPTTRRGPGLDVGRLARSRWVGDDRTWGELGLV